MTVPASPYVLLVEDSPGDASLVRSMLEGGPIGARVRWVRTLGEAEQALSGARPSLVLADLGLPDASGTDTLDALLQATPPDVPVVVLTGDVGESTGEAAIARGAHDFLRKSDLGTEPLSRCVRYALSSRATVAALRVAEGPLRSLLDAAVALAFIDPDGRILEANAGVEQLTGYRRNELVGTELAALASPVDRGLVEAAVAPPPAAAAPPVEALLRRADGGEAAVRFCVAPVEGGEDAPAAWTVLLQDLTQQRQAERTVRVRGRLLDAVGEAVLAADADGRITYLNAAAERLHGVEAADVVGGSLAELLALPDLAGRLRGGVAAHREAVRRTSTLQRPDGETDLRVTITPTADAAGLVDGWIAVAVDVTERTGMQRQLAHQALHDGLTGLPNRALLMDRLAHALERARRQERPIAVLFLDLDNFKAVNDTYGHDAGDEVLAAVAQLLIGAVRPGDTVARLGGDEFVIGCEEVSGVEEAMQIAERICEALAQPFGTMERERRVSASIGVAMLEPGDTGDVGALLRNADAAMYLAKQRGRRRVEVFSEELRSRHRRHVQLREDLLHVGEEQLTVLFQPQVRLSTGSLVGFEALLRWHHPELGEISPVEFIPLAEESGLILPLGRLVVERACTALARWHELRPEHALTVSVNLSARQLTDGTLTAFVAEQLDRTGIEPAALCMEITESVLMDNAEDAVRRLRDLKALGVQLAIDDFGTGYSSLAYLRRFPLDMLKVDREFVSSLGANPEDAAIVASVTRLAGSLHLDVLAEGVETEEQRDELAALGCDLGQGFLWSRPIGERACDDLVLTGAPWLPARLPDRAVADALAAPHELSVDEVVSVLRHELANPLTVIQCSSELLRDAVRAVASSDDAALAADSLAAIERSSEDVRALIDALADLRSIGAGRIQLQRRPTDLGELVRACVADLGPGLEGREVDVAIDDACARTDVDVARIRQIVANLLVNAVRHTPPGAAVAVGLACVGDAVQLSVDDAGPGVPADKVGMLFRKFSRLGSGAQGTGLGLFLSRGLARAHGGDLRYRRSPLGGAGFVLTLPRAAVVLDPPAVGVQR